jgi:hypothetical protein
MSATLTIRDETLGGEGLSEWALDVLTERITIRELIRSRVYQEVQDFNRTIRQRGRNPTKGTLDKTQCLTERPLSSPPYLTNYARLSKNSARFLSITSVRFSKRTGKGFSGSAPTQRSARCLNPSAVTSAMSQFVLALY